jgi:two-component system response regulator LytT
MRILIVEDERPTAEDIRDLTRAILGSRVSSVKILVTLHDALDYLADHAIDVLLLDLNLNDRDGFEILRQAVARAFHTIVISAYSDRAIEAFEYGVLDFVPKPYNRARLSAAFDRLRDSHALDQRALKNLSVRRFGMIEVVPLKEVEFFKAANVYTELHLADGSIKIYDKSLKDLKKLLPSSYLRIHKSYMVDLGNVRKVFSHGGGRYDVELKSGARLPLSRVRARELKKCIDPFADGGPRHAGR